ncbi:membrane hypothetical protein [Gammaproteobacteria bacterium]
MTMELFFYILLVMSGFFFCFVTIHQKIFLFYSFFILSAYSLVVRYAGFDIDMNTYANALTFNDMQLYYLREPVYWIGSKFIYQVIPEPELVFFIYDVLCISIVLSVCNRLRLPKYFVYLWFCFFPCVMGMQNVFRACS